MPPRGRPSTAAGRGEERTGRIHTIPAQKGLQMAETAIDREAMGRLAKALVFLCGANHPTTVALRTASESGLERDIKNARTLFLRMKPGDRRAALAMIES
jgi:hypothetical protein